MLGQRPGRAWTWTTSSTACAATVTEPDRRILAVIVAGRPVARLIQGDGGQLSLAYDEDWRTNPSGFPLSLSLPLARTVHPDRPVRSFLWGLLPDNERVLDRWARDHHVSAGNPFALLRHVGEDCAGAAQIAPLDRVDAILAGDGGVEWIDEQEIAERVRVLRQDPAAWHLSRSGQFSLAGAQAKTALYFDPTQGRWGDPWGAVPTTHILKPAVAGFDDHDLNEHLCLEIAHRLGFTTARSRIMSFGGERVIVVDRYDRVVDTSGTITRIHQEDACQALGVPPTAKYQNEGGPGPEQLIDLLRQESTPPSVAERNVAGFVDALALQWLLAGTDAHAKNYSVLLGPGQVRLAPLYDLASALPYDDMYLPKLKLAMRIGGEYGMERIGGRQWRRFATANKLDPDGLVVRLRDLVDRAPSAVAASVQTDAIRKLDSGLPQRLADRVAQRLAWCRAALDRT
jgi:serine/threonine-protein kinase HipA